MRKERKDQVKRAVGDKDPDPLPRIWVCVHKVSIVCGNMWDSPQGFPPNSSTALLHCRGVRLKEKQCGHPCTLAPAAPSCRPAEQNFIDYFTRSNHSNPLHCTCVLAKVNSQGGGVPSPRDQHQVWKIRHLVLSLQELKQNEHSKVSGGMKPCLTL